MILYTRSIYEGKELYMRLTDKRLLPYYLIAVLMIIASIGAVCVIVLTSDLFREEETTTTEPSTVIMNDDIPWYADIPASAFQAEKFAYNDGRIEYNDADVGFSTGIDVSSFQGNIDWEKVAADGIEFAIIRVGLRGYGAAGSIHIDDNAEKNIKGANAAGLSVGVYFYSQAISVEEAIEEADFVLDIIKKHKITAPVVFDWENEPDINMRTDNLDGTTLTDCAVAFCERIRGAGYMPAVYFNLTDAYQRYDLSRIKDYTLWYAQHRGTSPEFYYNYNIWQYSDSGKVNGIKGNVDLNISFNVG